MTAKKTPRPKAAPARTPRAAGAPAAKAAPARKTAAAGKTAPAGRTTTAAKAAKTAKAPAKAVGKVAKAAKRPAGPALKKVAATPAARKSSDRSGAPRPAAKVAKKAVKTTGAPKAPRQRTQPKPARETDVVARLRDIVINALEDLKARDVVELDVTGRTSIADIIVVAGGTSSRHVKSIADEVIKQTKKAGLPPLGVEGQREAEWVLVDLGDIVVHIMLPRARDFYGLERLWSVDGDSGTASAV